jgi:hypothetical protein
MVVFIGSKHERRRSESAVEESRQRRFELCCVRAFSRSCLCSLFTRQLYGIQHAEKWFSPQRRGPQHAPGFVLVRDGVEAPAVGKIAAKPRSPSGAAYIYESHPSLSCLPISSSVPGLIPRPMDWSRSEAGTPCLSGRPHARAPSHLPNRHPETSPLWCRSGGTLRLPRFRYVQ